MGDDGQELGDVGDRVDGDYLGGYLNESEDREADAVVEHEGGLPAAHVAGAPSLLQGQVP